MEQPHSWKCVLQINTNPWSLSTAQSQCKRTFSLQSKPSFLQASNLVALSDYFCTAVSLQKKSISQEEKKSQITEHLYVLYFLIFRENPTKLGCLCFKVQVDEMKSSILKEKLH